MNDFETSSKMDSIDLICEDIFQKIRTLEKEKAFFSIHTLVDSFLSITDEFAINPSEYIYYRDKYQSKKESELDISRTEIIEYLASMIQRLETVTHKKFIGESETESAIPPEPEPEPEPEPDPDSVVLKAVEEKPMTTPKPELPILATENSVTPTEITSDIISDILTEIIPNGHSKKESSNTSSDPSVVSPFVPPEQELKKPKKQTTAYQRISMSRNKLTMEEQELQEQLQNFPDLQEIFDETMNLDHPNEQLSLRKPVFSLKYFGYPEKAPEMDYMKIQKERLEKKNAPL